MEQPDIRVTVLTPSIWGWVGIIIVVAVIGGLSAIPGTGEAVALGEAMVEAVKLTKAYNGTKRLTAQPQIGSGI